MNNEMKRYKFGVQSFFPQAKRLRGAERGHSSFIIWHSAFPRRGARRGFTLLEMVVALGVFSGVMIIAFGIAISINNAQFKASRIQIVQDDLRFALESMTKEMRTGTNFQGSDSVGNNGYRKITFRRSDSVDITYCRRSFTDAIRKITGGGTTDCSDSSAQAVTGDDVTIEALTFYLIGATPGAGDGQPRITVSLRARSADPKLLSSFSIQTTVGQRLRDY
ncbi:MAG: hypothetical protein A3A44_00205 [Candidatus Sungbacteria bacterium RIFCSPLOWO2_01_FULL_60_25]|uniref:Type II secretion system protein J n=1 Tax=Candidatus Sungbacteria bacterium RIFCSPLOWO2_01_FULL_60_25 TaxID=1802281 RepID=A0A1G2LC50_9BACT|nr:MAG: hypothetical protein A3A44_00205 [Candidatus Sungbacteria bacterium RIFCSPLOWO2_01_FULL_60_25]